MKTLTIIGLLMFFSLQAIAQDSKPIDVINGKIYHDDVPITMRTVKEIVRPYPAAYGEVKSGRSRITWGWIVGMTGAVSLGGGLGTWIAGGTGEGEGELDPVTGIGVGIPAMIGGMLLVKSGGNRIENGINIYNSTIKSTSSLSHYRVRVGISKHGFGLIVNF